MEQERDLQAAGAMSRKIRHRGQPEPDTSPRPRRNASAIRRRSKALSLDLVADNCPAGIVVIDALGAIRYANQRAQKIFGLAADQYEGEVCSALRWKVTDFEGRPQEDGELVFSRAMRSKQAIDDVEHAIERADGSRVYLKISGQPIFREDGTLMQAVFTLMDVSDAVRAQWARQASDRRFQQLVENLNEGVVQIDRDNRVVFVNPRFNAMLGSTSEWNIGRPMFDVFPPETHDIMRARMKQRSRLERDVYETEVLRLDGSRLRVLIAAAPLVDEKGDYNGSVAAFTDITVRNREAAATKELKDRLEATLSSLSEGVLVMGDDGLVRYCNQSAELLLGRPAADIVNNPNFIDAWSYFDERGQSLTHAELPLPRTLETGEPNRNVVVRIDDGAGHDRWLMINSVAQFREGESRPYQAVGSFTDISSFKQAELELRSSRQHLELVLDRAPIGMALVSLDGRFLQVNQALCDIVGYPERILLNMDFQQITHADDLTTDLSLLRQLIDGAIPHYRMDKRYFHRAGHVVLVRLSVGLIRDEHGSPRHFVSQIEDVTHQRQIELRLRESEERLRLMLDGVADYEIQMLDPDGTVVQCNAASHKLSGLRPEALHGQSAGRSYSGKPPEHFPMVLRAASLRGRFEEQGLLVRADASTYWAQTIITALRGEDGRLLGYCRVTQDLTRQKRDEEEKATLLERLARNLRSEERQNRDASAVARLIGLLQSCNQEEELFPLLRSFCQSHFSAFSGSLYLSMGVAGRMDAALEWGSLAQHDYPTLEVSECRALTGGHGCVHRKSGESLCSHTPADFSFGFCMPIQVQDKTLGLLQLYRRELDPRESGQDDDDRKFHLAELVTESLGMAMANLRLRADLRAQSLIDSLTGLYNRRHLSATLDHEMDRCRRGIGPCCVLLIDVDHFKRFNDQHGHQAGDAALVAVAEAIRTHSRSTDVCCRYGGEEIVVVLPVTSLSNAQLHAERIREAVLQRIPVFMGASLPALSVSIGISEWSAQDRDQGALLARADRALYAAKAAGRNLVQCA